MNFLDHEMLVAALFRRIHIPFDDFGFLLHLVAVQIVEGDAVGAHPRKLQIIQIVNITRIFQNRRNIRSQKRTMFCFAQNERAVLARGIDFIRIIAEHDRQRIGSADSNQRMVDRVHRRAQIFFIIIIDQLDRDFRIRLGIEYIALAQQLITKLLIVFDDAVVHAHDVFIIAYVRVRVRFAGFAVGRPARMPDAAGALNGASAIRLFIQNGKPALRLYDGQALFAAHGDARRIIAPVFQLCKAVQQNGRSLLISGISHDSAHIVYAPIFSFDCNCTFEMLRTPDPIFDPTLACWDVRS